jgi:hypothetical protein
MIWEQSIEYYDLALAIAQEIGDQRGEGNRLGNLGTAYYSLGQVAHCNAPTCASGSTNALDTTGSVGYFTSITIGADGLPIISYTDATYVDLKVAHCSNPFCVPYWQRR